MAAPQIVDIRLAVKRRREGWKQTAIAEEQGVTQPAISAALKKRDAAVNAAVLADIASKQELAGDLLDIFWNDPQTIHKIAAYRELAKTLGLYAPVAKQVDQTVSLAGYDTTIDPAAVAAALFALEQKP